MFFHVFICSTTKVNYIYIVLLYYEINEAFNEISEAYNDFIQKIMSVINKVSPVKERRVKQNSQEWFDGEIADEIKNRDKLFKKFKKSKFHIEKEFYKVRNMIFNKKRLFFEKKLSESIGNLKIYGKH